MKGTDDQCRHSGLAPNVGCGRHFPIEENAPTRQVFGFHLGSDNRQLPSDRHLLGDFIMIQGEFDLVWTLCWMEGFALPPAAWLYGILIGNSEVDLF